VADLAVFVVEAVVEEQVVVVVWPRVVAETSVL